MTEREWALAIIECDSEAERMWNYQIRSVEELHPGVEGQMPGEGGCATPSKER